MATLSADEREAVEDKPGRGMDAALLAASIEAQQGGEVSGSEWQVNAGQQSTGQVRRRRRTLSTGL